MSFAKVFSAQSVLLGGEIISIEIDLSKGLHAFNIVGLPDKAVEESRDRVGAAIKNSGFKSPKNKNQKVVVSLAPADLKKEGPSFDLGIAVAYLLSSKDIEFDPDKKLFLGELSLDGKLRKIKGVLPIIMKAKKEGFEEIFLPEENVYEASLMGGIKIFGFGSLNEVLEHLLQKKLVSPAPKGKIKNEKNRNNLDFGDIKGQNDAKRGLLIAAAGGHNLAMYGPAGTGKTMLARAFSGILPALDFDEVLEMTAIYSVAGELKSDLITSPPFRSPHHTSSYVSLVGGGSYPKPGEVTLAHRGVLFLDEFPEFDKRVLDSLREPLEDRVVSISRARGKAKFPASFILIAAMNPCPCGNFGTDKTCSCSPISIERYKKKLSGPIMDRIDLWVEVSGVCYEELTKKNENRESEKILKMVASARKKQKERFGRLPIKTNSEMGVKEITGLLHLGEEVKRKLSASAETLKLSARLYHKVIKLARTIADLENSNEILEDHIMEALQYRPKIFY
ncbi:magnesium chelatase [Candidatus Campbellbacteria bacterium CG11_big_fil_rev_8_21_14_0_20_44_21]|uniref:Magnesium chelatase n=1 Tax=Candidatus Campbellbacteria bacterium CG22_combo_CG10-13_8_21_14_all_43_18 TaxID=1974530 RepID=A0A2H0DW09_9BACT|nr:MAG: magnesium chelatase [Candidatus Campbellbacteria bacterium CG22_combo_CG10-13_8_21_14_all_43_18]PIR24184.1 MAG: magnesium chelatase [Candidatus Campbellbacteria bacterium CG11_big_fil_rev_8_21_14_0_20_44_21]